MILWAALGACLAIYGGMLLNGAYTAITRPDIARVIDIEMTKPLLVVVVVFSTLLVFGGFMLFGSSLLAAASVLQ